MELNRGCCSMCWLNCHDDDSKATKPKWIFGRANKQNHAYCKCPFQYQSVRIKRSYWIKCFPRWRRIHFQIHINGWDMRMHTQTRIAHMFFFVCVVYSDIAYKQKRSLQNPSIDFPLSMYPATTVEVWECRNVSARVSRTTTITNSNFPCLRYWTLNTNIHSHTHTQRVSPAAMKAFVRYSHTSDESIQTCTVCCAMLALVMCVARLHITPIDVWVQNGRILCAPETATKYSQMISNAAHRCIDVLY